ncbi:D-alanyl-D-alanine carboxypeptidase/D-alanyl-D-alanine-endopeptidase [Streptomyces piniterrae]|uniref:D-alanyl-D-alanine carboxypeptidase/D-alanyl-D-alanine-endopeptidase n=1 Tax=Streptomyces piniterrae TaxID=2571125 RepID=A0A4U0MPL7_9ACTN|nr:D-alanyl-D-alanine carboxypeptidase/D-alanyl-D-alanine-endopeptidase [Streptomyces piniterrae]TJZ42775.1 D-alanyl-D-alanine carboxypeptidase/D-alanyl-D-alanine-endopeptidase [Streptomyces piniterrae]
MPETRKWQVRWQSAQRCARETGQSARAASGAAREAWRSAPRQTRQTWRLTAVSAATGLAVAVVAVAASGPWDSGQRTAERALAAAGAGTGGEHHGPGHDPAAPEAPPVLAALGGPAHGAAGRGAAPAPTGAGLADALAPLLKDPSLGSLRAASVVDVASGHEVFGARQGTATTPASTVKLATAVAALAELGADHRIDTTVVSGAKNRVVLIGGGDPTLTARAPRHGAEEHPANLRTLADDTARALKKRGTTKIALGYDTSAYSGPVLHPIGPNENIAPVVALMADEARLDRSEHGTAPREADPAAAAARTFAGLLRERGITVDVDARPAKAPARHDRLAAVHSLPLSALVERMLTYSDNDIAEALARQTAIAAGQPASFAGAGKAVRGALARRHLPLTGAVFADGSGLDRADKVSAALLSHLLLQASAPDHPALRPVLTGLPVAAFTGTLSGRYAGQTAGAGAVRAKTGTLTGVNTLAGTVVDADGRLLVFAFMTSGTGSAQGAQEALDRLASAVANCGCR